MGKGGGTERGALLSFSSHTDASTRSDSRPLPNKTVDLFKLGRGGSWVAINRSINRYRGQVGCMDIRCKACGGVDDFVNCLAGVVGLVEGIEVELLPAVISPHLRPQYDGLSSSNPQCEIRSTPRVR